MRYKINISAVILSVCFVICGCATMRYPGAYKVEGMEFKDFGQIDDDRALKVVALIYNVKSECWEDGIAKSLALQEYLNLLSKRKSQYVKKSGVFEIKFEKVKLSSWSDNDLVRLYDCLEPKARMYYTDSAQELNETQNAQRIVYLTGINSAVSELKRRDITQKTIMIAGQVLSTALMVALSFI
jgi:hypothetical protein